MMRLISHILGIAISILKNIKGNIDQSHRKMITQKLGIVDITDHQDILSWNKDIEFPPYEVQLSHKLAKFPFIVRNETSDVAVFRQVFISQEYNFFVEKEPDVIVDAGANIGLTSIYLASKYKNSKIIAIEPEISNYKILKKNAEPYDNIFPLHAALWKEDGTIEICDTGEGHWAFRVNDTSTAINSKTVYCHHARAIKTETLMQEFAIKNIDIFKLDIEGAEKEVFEDTSQWIEKITTVIIELHERIKPGCKRSFYNGSNGFDSEFQLGENIYLVRNEYLSLNID